MIKMTCENITKNDRMKAFQAFLEKEGEKFSKSDWKVDEVLFSSGNREYLVLSDEEADEKVKEEIEESLWAFNSDFLEDEIDIEGIGDLIKLAQDKCEGANKTIKALVEKSVGIDKFVEDAIAADGRGHFLSSYDSAEHEIRIKIDDKNCWMFIYRIN